MSSYSEYLNRQQQRLQKFKDTRPHLDASHHTTNVKRLAAGQVLEQWNPAPAGVMVLDGPSTRVNSFYAQRHQVQDTSMYNEYTAGQAYSQHVNRKAPQIQETCYSSAIIPEYNDRLASNTQLAAIQDQKNKFQRGWNTSSCCVVCGKPPAFANGCNCSLTTAQRNQLKDNTAPLQHTAS
jgi:hypothetical protein